MNLDYHLNPSLCIAEAKSDSNLDLTMGYLHVDQFEIDYFPFDIDYYDEYENLPIIVDHVNYSESIESDKSRLIKKYT